MPLPNTQEVWCAGLDHDVAPLVCVDRLTYELLQERRHRCAGLTERGFQTQPWSHGHH